MKKWSWITVLMLLSMLALAACGNDSSEPVVSENDNQANQVEKTEDEEGAAEPEIRIIEHSMGVAEVPANPQRIVVLTGDALEAILSVGVKPVGSVEAMGDTEWYPHLEDQMAGVTNVGTMSEPNLELIHQLEPDLILGTKSRQEGSFELLNAIAPTVFTETHTLGNWKEDLELYLEAINKREEGLAVLAKWEQRAAALSERLATAEKLSEEVAVLRFTAGQGRYFYNNSYSGSILKELGFARPEKHDDDENWVENITQERIPEMDSDIIFYFVLDDGSGDGYGFANEWIETELFKNLRASQKDQLYEVSDAYWNMTYGIISADYVLDDIERIILGE